jgi:hypothetical protein
VPLDADGTDMIIIPCIAVFYLYTWHKMHLIVPAQNLSSNSLVYPSTSSRNAGLDRRLDGALSICEA